MVIICNALHTNNSNKTETDKINTIHTLIAELGACCISTLRW